MGVSQCFTIRLYHTSLAPTDWIFLPIWPKAMCVYVSKHDAVLGVYIIGCVPKICAHLTNNNSDNDNNFIVIHIIQEDNISDALVNIMLAFCLLWFGAHILQGCFTGAGTIKRHPEEYVSINLHYQVFY